MHIPKSLSEVLHQMLARCYPTGGSREYDENFLLVSSTDPRAPSGVPVLDSEDWKAGWNAAVKEVTAQLSFIRSLDSAVVRRAYGLRTKKRR